MHPVRKLVLDVLCKMNRVNITMERSRTYQHRGSNRGRGRGGYMRQGARSRTRSGQRARSGSAFIINKYRKNYYFQGQPFRLSVSLIPVPSRGLFSQMSNRGQSVLVQDEDKSETAVVLRKLVAAVCPRWSGLDGRMWKKVSDNVWDSVQRERQKRDGELGSEPDRPEPLSESWAALVEQEEQREIAAGASASGNDRATQNPIQRNKTTKSSSSTMELVTGAIKRLDLRDADA
ncbi:hypothetical protein [Probopyrinella latreuticola Nege-like virus]|nr:hypothetical protein [Probopyrinella latreuticola Nege-like virus]